MCRTLLCNLCNLRLRRLWRRETNSMKRTLERDLEDATGGVWIEHTRSPTRAMLQSSRDERTFTKALSRAYAFRRSEEVQWKREAERNLETGSPPIESPRKQFCGFAWQRNRGCCATESSFGPDSSGCGFGPIRGVGCGADAGAVSATAPAQNPGGRFSRFANGCGEEEKN